MKRCVIFTLIFTFLSGTHLLAQITIAIGDFKNNSDVFHLDAWEKSIPEFLKSELSQSDKLIVVERRQLESVLREQALSMTGLVDSATAQKVGSILGAAFIISGSIHKSDDWVRIDAKIIRASTGQVRSEKVQAPDDTHLSEMITLLGNNISFILSGEGEYQQKKTLRTYPTGYFLIASAGLAVATVLVNNSYQNKVDEYHNADNLSDIEDSYNSANNLNNARIILATLTGVAIAGTIYCWLNDLSADELISQDQVFIPSFYIDGNGGVYASINIQF
jgi:TolB-like protein